MFPPLPPFSIEACRGTDRCPNAVMNTSGLAKRLEQALQSRYNEANASSPHSVLRVSLSGCPNSCSQPQIRDFGFQARMMPLVTEEPCIHCGSCAMACPEGSVKVAESGPVFSPDCLACGRCVRICPSGTLKPGKIGWTLLAGGKLGRVPRFGIPVGHFLTNDEALELLLSILDRYLAEASRGERLRSWLERTLWKNDAPSLDSPWVAGLTSMNDRSARSDAKENLACIKPPA